MSEMFTLERGWHRSYPTVEILSNGQPFWDDLPGAKDHFSFGRKKAIILLSCLDIIKTFYDSGGVQPGPGEAKTVLNIASQEEIKIRYLTGFKLRGNWVNRPYLEIVGKRGKVGLGMMKSKAILELEGEIRKFVKITKGY